jgi:hypothetical protein
VDTNEAVGLSPEEAFARVRGLLVNVAKGIHRAGGGELDELVAESYYHFLTAYRKYRAGKGRTFPAYVGFQVHKLLLQQLRLKEGQRWRQREGLDEESVSAPDHFDLGAFLTEVSEDARLVVSLALDHRRSEPLRHPRPPEKQECSIWLAQFVKRAVAEYLKEMGWATSRICEAFEEVREAI